MTFREVKADLLKGASYCVDYQYLAKLLYNPEKKNILFHQNDYTFLLKRLYFFIETIIRFAETVICLWCVLPLSGCENAVYLKDLESRQNPAKWHIRAGLLVKNIDLA